jgi:glycerol kinase
VDGGLSASDWAVQFTADMLGYTVERPDFQETTALGAAYLTGLAAGLCPESEEFSHRRPIGRRFLPMLDDGTRRRQPG